MVSFILKENQEKFIFAFIETLVGKSKNESIVTTEKQLDM